MCGSEDTDGKGQLPFHARYPACVKPSLILRVHNTEEKEALQEVHNKVKNMGNKQKKLL